MENEEGAIGTKFGEEHVDVGFAPGVNRWTIEKVGTITVEQIEFEGEQIEAVRYPGWLMRSLPDDPNAPYIATTSGAYAGGPDMASKLRIGGWSVQELQAIAAEKNAR